MITSWSPATTPRATAARSSLHAPTGDEIVVVLQAPDDVVSVFPASVDEKQKPFRHATAVVIRTRSPDDGERIRSGTVRDDVHINTTITRGPDLYTAKSKNNRRVEVHTVESNDVNGPSLFCSKNGGPPTLLRVTLLVSPCQHVPTGSVGFFANKTILAFEPTKNVDVPFVRYNLFVSGITNVGRTGLASFFNRVDDGVPKLIT